MWAKRVGGVSLSGFNDVGDTGLVDCTQLVSRTLTKNQTKYPVTVGPMDLRHPNEYI